MEVKDNGTEQGFCTEPINTDVSTVASHSCAAGNSIEQIAIGFVSFKQMYDLNNSKYESGISGGDTLLGGASSWTSVTHHGKSDSEIFQLYIKSLGQDETDKPECLHIAAREGTDGRLYCASCGKTE